MFRFAKPFGIIIVIIEAIILLFPMMFTDDHRIAVVLVLQSIPVIAIVITVWSQRDMEEFGRGCEHYLKTGEKTEHFASKGVDHIIGD